MVHCDTDRVVKNHFEIGEKVWVGKITSLLKGVCDILVGVCVVEIYADGSLSGCKVEILLEISGRGWIFIGVSDAG